MLPRMRGVDLPSGCVLRCDQIFQTGAWFGQVIWAECRGSPRGGRMAAMRDEAAVGSKRRREAGAALCCVSRQRGNGAIQTFAAVCPEVGNGPFWFVRMSLQDTDEARASVALAAGLPGLLAGLLPDIEDLMAGDGVDFRVGACCRRRLALLGTGRVRPVQHGTFRSHQCSSRPRSATAPSSRWIDGTA